MAVQSDYCYSLTVNGNSQFDVVSFVLTEHLSSLFRAELALAGFDNAPAFAEILNHPATLTFWQDDTSVRYLNGIVTGFKQQESGFSRTRYQMVIEPALSRANLQADLRIFQQQDSQQIIETLLRKNQVTQHQFHFSDAYWTREYCVQYRETDLAFIERLAAEEGTYYYFEHIADHHILHFSNSSGLAESKGRLLYNAMPAGERPEAAVWHWAYEEKLAGTQQTLRDYTFTHPRYHQEHQAVRNTPNIFGEHRDAQYESYDYPGRYKRDAQGKPFTRYRLEYLQREAELATAKSDDLRVIPGYCFTLTGHRRAHYNRDWLVVGVTHRGWQSGVLEEESGEQGNRYENDIKLIPQGRQWRPTPQPKPRVDGLQVAHVVGPAEEEIYCDEWGRVKVQFPWDRQGNNDEHSSCWIRVSQGWAGAQFGSIAIPRIGHEVLVGFLEGDPDQPIITGRTYHGTTEPPYPLPTHKTRMTIKSKTHKGEGFNELRFDDEKEQEEIFIHAQKNQNNVVNHDETTKVGRNRSEKVGRNEKITVGKNRSQTIKQNELLTVGFNRMTNIAMNELHNVGMMRSLNVLLSQKEMVGQDFDLTVGKDYRIDVGNNTHFSTAQLLTMISQNMHVTGKDEIRLDSKGGQIHLNEKGITLKGIVTIEGPLTVKGEAMAGGRSVEGECTACKQAAAVGRPVNPILGIKLLTNEVDFALPGLLPLTWRRSYYSDIPAGEMGNWLGQGWRVNGSQWIEGRLQSVALDNPLDTPLNDGQETAPKSTALESFYYLDEQGREIPLPREIDGTPIFIQTEQIWVHYIGAETIEIANTTKSVRMTFRCLPPQTARQRQDGQTSIRYFTLQTIQDNHGNRQQFLYGQGLYGQYPLPYAVTDGNGRVFALQFKHMAATTATASPIAATASATIPPETGDRSPLWRLTDIYLLPQPFSAVNLTQLQETLQKHTALSEVSGVSSDSGLGKKLVSYRYNAEGDLIEVKDGLGYVVRKFAYRNHLMIAHEDAAGLVSTYEYDHYRPSGKVIRNSTNLGERWEFAYFPSYTQVTDVLGRTEEYHFDEHRELIKFVAANGQATLQERDKLGRVLSQTDPSGQTRYFEYNPQGQMTKLTRPDNVMLYFMYDNDGRLTGQTDALGNMTRYRYDERGNLIERLDALKQKTQYVYNDKGLLTSSTDPLGNDTLFAYDENSQLSQVTDCSGNPTRFSYNEWGQLTAQTDALGHTTSYDYNDRQQLIAMILPNQSRTTYRYDNAGRMAAVIDPQGNKTAYQYRADGLLCIKTNAQGHRFQYHYDLAGRLVGLTNENQAAYRFVYDESDRVIWEKGFDDKLTQYEYDEQGRLTTQREYGISDTIIPTMPKKPNQTAVRETAFHYDRQGRLTKQQIKQDQQQHTTHYRYDANGRLTEIDNGESRLAYRYDALGRLVEETVTHQMLDNAATKVSYQYDANGNRIKTGLPSGDDIHYFYYGTGHLSGIKLNHQLISEITRDKRHREITRTQGRITGEYQYNPLGQLTKQQAGLTESTAIRILARTFSYDPSGNLQQSDTRLFTGGQFEHSQTTYQYDPLGRIEHAHTEGNGSVPHDERFRFDPAHNLIEHDNQIIKNNRISHYAGVGFTYDSLGNTLATTYDKDNRVSYRYDLHDRLIGAEISTRYRKERWVYYYDAVGRRIAKAKLNKQGEPEIHTVFVWDGSHLVQEIQKGKNAQETDRTFTYIYRHPNSYEPLAQCIGRKEENPNRIEHEINYFHCDQIGIPREMTDSQGKLIWRGRYDAWGGLHYDRHLAQQNQGHQPFRLQNQYIDQETGLHYNFLRYYEPMTGRFMTQDPIGLAGGNNLYQFADNAQGWVDPLGLARFCTRALKNIPGSSDIDPNFRGGLDLGIFHEHIFYDDGTNIGYGGDGLFSETSMKGYKCSNTHYDDETMRQAVNNVKNRTKPTLEKADNGEIVIRDNQVFGNDNYSLLMNNCQDFATEVEKEYFKIKKVK